MDIFRIYEFLDKWQKDIRTFQNYCQGDKIADGLFWEDDKVKVNNTGFLLLEIFRKTSLHILHKLTFKYNDFNISIKIHFTSSFKYSVIEFTQTNQGTWLVCTEIKVYKEPTTIHYSEHSNKELKDFLEVRIATINDILNREGM